MSLVGRTISRYKITQKLGQGAMGEVYLARDTILKRPVAVKRLLRQTSEDEEGRRRFLKEAEHAAQLNHQHVAAVYDVLQVDREIFIVMEYVEGVTLEKSPPRPLQLEAFLDLAIQCAEALVAAHAQGLVHRDVKPANIMLTGAGKVKMLDFGVARELPTSLEDATTRGYSNADGSVAQGTVPYMAPEVLLGKDIDSRTDIFSLGVVFYELLTGHHPFFEKTLAGTAGQILQATPASIPSLNSLVPESVNRIVFRMLAKNPQDRYATASDLAADLQHLGSVQAGEPTERLSGDVVKRGIPWSAAALSAALLAAVVAVPFWYGSGGTDLPEHPTLALLPFKADTPDARDSAFARGLRQSVNERLSRLAPGQNFAVVSAGFSASREISELGKIAPEVGANLALDGELKQEGTDHRVTLRLVLAGTGSLIAEEGAAAPIGDALALENEIIHKTLQVLQAPPYSGEESLSYDIGTDNPAAYHLFLRGRGLMEEPGESEAAREQFQRALSLDPTFLRARVALAMTLLSEPNSPSSRLEAERECSAVAATAPEVTEAHLCLADVSELRGDLKKEMQYLETAHHYDSFNPDIIRRLYYVYRAIGGPEKLREIENTLHDAIQRQPDFWQWHSLLGVLLFHSSRYQESIEEMRKLVDLAPQYYRALDNLGACYAELGQWDKASRALEQSIAIRPGAAAYNNLGVAYFYQGQYQKAVELFQRALVQGFAGDYLLHGNLADSLYWSPGERDKARYHYLKAVEIAEEALRESPNNPTILGRLAIYCAMLDEPEKANQYLTRGMELAPDEAEMQFRAAQVYQRLGEFDRVVPSLRRAFELGLLKDKVLYHPLFEELRRQKAF